MRRIPIENFAKDMETINANEKKNEILELLKKYNQIGLPEEFDGIEKILHKLIREGDIELIKIYLSDTIQDGPKDLAFKIDRTNRTASLFGINHHSDIAVIPRTVHHESIDYLVTSISHVHSEVRVLRLACKSAIKTIYQYSFYTKCRPSLLEEIDLPKSMTEFKDNWCVGLDNLKTVENNSNSFYFCDKYLIGKSDENNDDYDIFYYAIRNVEYIYLPSSIKVISSFAFEKCKNLYFIEITSDSNLQKIDKHAFSGTNISEIYFPDKLNELANGWCFGTNNLKKINISESNDRFIFKNGKYLLGKSDTKNDNFDTLLFASRDIKEFSIPSNIKFISACAFENCKNLAKIEIPINSNLQTIESYTFKNTKIKEIYIPSKITKICGCAFYECKDLIKVKIGAVSNLQIIESFAFYATKINAFSVPPTVTEIGKNAFIYCSKLQIFEIQEDSKLESFNVWDLTCPYHNILIMVPSSLRKLINK